MNVDRFRKICSIASVLLKIVTVISVLFMLSALYGIFTDRNVWFDYNMPDFPIINSMRGPMEEADMQLAALIVSPILILIACYIFWKGSQLFKHLADGHTPFSYDFAETVKKLSLVLIVTDVVSPLFYSLLVTLIMEGRYYYIIGVGSSFMLGLILYAVSEIFKYGVELQTLSDETV